MVERRAGMSSSRAISELLLSPILQRRLFVIQEDATVLHGRRTVMASIRLHIQRVVVRRLDIRPPVPKA